MKRVVKTLLPDRLNRWIGRLVFAIASVRRYMREGIPEESSHISFSQEGEDMILRYLLGGQATGFYVDVGAHHPRRFSNTCVFYRRGWRGINIDPDGEAVEALRRERPEDINLALGVARERGELEMTRYSESALNSLDVGRDKRMEAAGYEVSVVGSELVPVQPLHEILEKHLPGGQRIDFMSIDAEGLDLEVVQSNDWGRFRPRLLLVECLGGGLGEVGDHPVIAFLTGEDYRAFARTVNTVILEDARVVDEDAPMALRAPARVDSGHR